MPAKRHSLRDQLSTAVARAQTVIDDTRVNRVLNLLTEQNLATVAAEQCGSSGLVTIESADLPHVWENERILARVAELEQHGISVESKQIEKDVAGMTFKRWAICVRY